MILKKCIYVFNKSSIVEIEANFVALPPKNDKSNCRRFKAMNGNHEQGALKLIDS